MTQLVGYRCFNVATGELDQTWGGIYGAPVERPAFLVITGKLPMVRYDHPDIGRVYDGYRIDEWWADPPPGPDPAEVARQATFANDVSRVDILNRLKTASAPQIRTFVTANVTDLASARTMLANILILIALDPRS